MPFDITCNPAWIIYGVLMIALRLWLSYQRNTSGPDWGVLGALLLGVLSVLILAFPTFLLDRTFGVIVAVALGMGYVSVLWGIFRRNRRDSQIVMAQVKRKRKRYPGGRLPY